MVGKLQHSLPEPTQISFWLFKKPFGKNFENVWWSAVSIQDNYYAGTNLYLLECKCIYFGLKFILRYDSCNCVRSCCVGYKRLYTSQAKATTVLRTVNFFNL